MRTPLRIALSVLTAALSPHVTSSADTHGVVPGTGARIAFVGDDFEDPSWHFVHNHPKSSREIDERTRLPRGVSTNGRWFEGPERGQPDLMKVVSAPAGGLPGSAYGLLVRTLHSGIPGHNSRDVQQDDLVVDCRGRIGAIPISEMPSAVVRVHLPPPAEWENRTGPHFGFRTAAVTTVVKSEPRKSRFRVRPETTRELDTYWPGIWIHFRSETDPAVSQDAAFLTVRGNRSGRDFKVRDIPSEQFGWWTMGMSYTPDGMVHYYARPGIADLTAKDHLTSQYPYAYRAERFETMFFNFCNQNDGQSWSTPFVIDDPQLFIVKADRVEGIVRRRQQAQSRQARHRTDSRR